MVWPYFSPLSVFLQVYPGWVCAAITPEPQIRCSRFDTGTRDPLFQVELDIFELRSNGSYLVPGDYLGGAHAYPRHDDPCWDSWCKATHAVEADVWCRAYSKPVRCHAGLVRRMATWSWEEHGRAAAVPVYSYKRCRYNADSHALLQLGAPAPRHLQLLRAAAEDLRNQLRGLGPTPFGQH